MRLIILICLSVGVNFNFVEGKIFQKCELASVLSSTYNVSSEEVKNLVCIAEYESTFNTEAINLYNWDGSKDYGLFQLNNRYWCGEGQNTCKTKCEAFLDDDLTDDLRCVQIIIKDTKRWMKVTNGYVAWVAYVNRCQNRDLNEYMSECTAADVTTPAPTTSTTTTTTTTTTTSTTSKSPEETVTPRPNPVRGPQIPISPVFRPIPVRGSLSQQVKDKPTILDVDDTPVLQHSKPIEAVGINEGSGSPVRGHLIPTVPVRSNEEALSLPRPHLPVKSSHQTQIVESEVQPANGKLTTKPSGLGSAPVSSIMDHHKFLLNQAVIPGQRIRPLRNVLYEQLKGIQSLPFLIGDERQVFGSAAAVGAQIFPFKVLYGSSGSFWNPSLMNNYIFKAERPIPISTHNSQFDLPWMTPTYDQIPAGYPGLETDKMFSVYPFRTSPHVSHNMPMYQNNIVPQEPSRFNPSGPLTASFFFGGKPYVPPRSQKEDFIPYQYHHPPHNLRTPSRPTQTNYNDDFIPEYFF